MTRVGLLSDVHGNAAGLRAALGAIGEVDALFFLGDLVGYYFDVRECLDLLRDAGTTMLLGNHDAYFLHHLGLPHPATEGLAIPSPAEYRARYGPSLEIAAEALDREAIALLQALPPRRDVVLEGHRLTLVHGSPFRPVDEYVYPDHGAFDRFAGLEADVVAMGHTHRPLLHREGAVQLVNPGSCGQPRDGDPRAAAAVLSLGRTITCEAVRAEYDVDALIARCRARAPDTALLVSLLERGRRSAT